MSSRVCISSLVWYPQYLGIIDCADTSVFYPSYVAFSRLQRLLPVWGSRRWDGRIVVWRRANRYSKLPHGWRVHGSWVFAAGDDGSPRRFVVRYLSLGRKPFNYRHLSLWFGFSTIPSTTGQFYWCYLYLSWLRWAAESRSPSSSCHQNQRHQPKPLQQWVGLADNGLLRCDLLVALCYLSSIQLIIWVVAHWQQAIWALLQPMAIH